MLEICADRVRVEFPVYTPRSRSLRHALIIDRLARQKESVGKIGGIIDRSTPNRVVVTALDDISFVIREGDRVGLVGHNGAGKTTLLRVLAGIFEPVSGSITVNGRISPMFSMSDGMDPDSTGYENIRLRGLFLGLSRREIEANIEKIADFTELGEYLEMPIRTYSSGMMLRLAFAISTTINPEILLMDEMIGAGDATFVDRAEKRLKEFVDAAGIMVVASHSSGILSQWCNKAVLLHHGVIAFAGSVDDTLSKYDDLLHGR